MYYDTCTMKKNMINKLSRFMELTRECIGSILPDMKMRVHLQCLQQTRWRSYTVMEAIFSYLQVKKKNIIYTFKFSSTLISLKMVLLINLQTTFPHQDV